MCRGTSRRNTSRPSGTTENAIAATQDTKTPLVASTDASPTSSASFTAENTVLPTGTQGALRSPVSTPSCSVSTFQATIARMKPRPLTGPCRKRYEGPHVFRVSRKIPAPSATTTELPTYVRKMRRPVARPATGMKRARAPVRVTAVSPASSFIAAIAAEPWPTADGE